MIGRAPKRQPTPSRRDSATAGRKRPIDARPRSGWPVSLPSLFAAHWPLYAIEGAELGFFMLSACIFDVLIFGPHTALSRWPVTLRRGLMGISMGATAIAIIRSAWGKRSGGQFNPAVTLAFYRLGKMSSEDTIFYIVFQFLGGAAGVGVALLLLDGVLASPQVEYVVTVPGLGGVGAAFAAETFMATLLMLTVLFTGNTPRLARWTTWLVGVLITLYVLFFAPVSGFSINPARTTASAVYAGRWTAVWIYFTAPVLGMLFAAELFCRVAKAHPAPPGVRHFLTHRHLQQRDQQESADDVPA